MGACCVGVGFATAMVLIGVRQWAARDPHVPARQCRALLGIVDQLRPLFEGAPGEDVIKRGGLEEID